MKYLAHFQREGLVVQGPNSIWVPLGQFTTAEEAQLAPLNSRWGSQIQASRIVPLFHDTDGGYADSASEQSLQLKLRSAQSISENAIPVTLA